MRKSLETQPVIHNCWLQHFTLGEILKASGEQEEAASHFRSALELNPSFRPAEVQLQELGLTAEEWFDFYTYLIIGMLVLCVLFCLYITSPGSEINPNKPSKNKVISNTMRRFNNKRI